MAEQISISLHKPESLLIENSVLVRLPIDIFSDTTSAGAIKLSPSFKKACRLPPECIADDNTRLGKNSSVHELFVASRVPSKHLGPLLFTREAIVYIQEMVWPRETLRELTETGLIADHMCQRSRKKSVVEIKSGWGLVISVVTWCFFLNTGSQY